MKGRELQLKEAWKWYGKGELGGCEEVRKGGQFPVARKIAETRDA